MKLQQLNFVNLAKMEAHKYGQVQVGNNFQFGEYLSECLPYIEKINYSFQFSKAQLKALWQEAYDKKKLQNMQAILRLTKYRLLDIKNQRKKDKSKPYSTFGIFVGFKLRVDRFWIQILSMLTVDTRFSQKQFLSLYMEFVDLSFILIDSKSDYQQQQKKLRSLTQYAKLMHNTINFDKNQTYRQNQGQPLQQRTKKAQKNIFKIYLSLLYQFYQKYFQTQKEKVEKQIQEDINPFLVRFIKDVQKINYFSTLQKIFNAHLFQLKLKFVNGPLDLSISINFQKQLFYKFQQIFKLTSFQIRLDNVSVIIKYIGRLKISNGISFQALESFILKILQVFVISFDSLIQMNKTCLYAFIAQNNSFFEIKQIIVNFWKTYPQKRERALFFLQSLKKTECRAKILIQQKLQIQLGNKRGESYNQNSNHQEKIDHNKDIETTYQDDACLQPNITTKKVKQFKKRQKLKQILNLSIVQNRKRTQLILNYYNLFYEPYSMKKFYAQIYFQAQVQTLIQSQGNRNSFPLIQNCIISQQLYQEAYELDNSFPKQELNSKSQQIDYFNTRISIQQFAQIMKNRSSFRKLYLLNDLLYQFQKTSKLEQDLLVFLIDHLEFIEFNNIIQIVIYDLKLLNNSFLKLLFFLFKAMKEKIKKVIMSNQLQQDFALLKQLSRMLKYFSLISNGSQDQQTKEIIYCTNCRFIFKKIEMAKGVELMCQTCSIGFLDRIELIQCGSFQFFISGRNQIKLYLQRYIKKISRQRMYKTGRIFLLITMENYVKFL